MTSYAKMKKQEAAAALQEFLEERPRALDHLTQYLAGHAGDAVHLDGTVESLVPLWRWVKSVLTERTMETADSDASDSPSWLRYSLGTDPTLSSESVSIIDGVISYLCQVVHQGAPGSQWQVGHHRTKSYMWQNHPMLVHNNEEVPLADLVPGVARGQASGRHPSDDDKLARMAAAAIKTLNGGNEETGVQSEPLVEIEDLGEDELRGRELEVSVREDIAHEHSRQVDQLAKSLAKQDGIGRVVREDREVLLVSTAGWSLNQLEGWITRYLRGKTHD